jgi:hypothetical protein
LILHVDIIEGGYGGNGQTDEWRSVLSRLFPYLSLGGLAASRLNASWRGSGLAKIVWTAKLGTMRQTFFVQKKDIFFRASSR